MATPNDLRDPWLVAVWPGMGSVAFLAGSFLLQHLKVRRVAELDTRDFFEVQDVEIHNGIVGAGRLPRSMFFEWRDPRGHHDLLIFVGEAQPTTGGYTLCQRVVQYAVEHGVKRLFTFAAMATQLQLGTTPRVFAVATNEPDLAEIKNLGVEVMDDGQISGLNGVLLAAGEEHGLHGTCLLGELPYFALGVPNPRAAQAVLESFAALAGIDIDFTELEQQADIVEQQLEELLEQMSQAGSEAAEEEGDGEEGHGAEPGQTDEIEQVQMPPLDPKTQRKIESMFERARRDRSKAFELKQELDRLGVFKQYEDRFLDLFRKAE